MHGSVLRVTAVALAVVGTLGVAGCGARPTSPDGAVVTTRGGGAGESSNQGATGAPATGPTWEGGSARPGPGSGLAAGLERAGQEQEAEQASADTGQDHDQRDDRSDGTPGTVEAGTDSAATDAPPVVPELASRLERFGELYLAYDYREPAGPRLTALEELVAPELFVALSAPLPPALTATLEAEQRVVSVEPVEVMGLDTTPLGGGVFEISLAVTEQRTVAGETEVDERTQRLTVVVDDAGLVADVR